MQNLSLPIPDGICRPVPDTLLATMQESKAQLVRTAFAILHQQEDAEDAVQSAYLSAWLAWDRFRGGASVKTWLTSIVINKALTERRRKQRTWLSLDDDPALRAEAEMELARGQFTQEHFVIHQQVVERVRQRITQLPASTRQTVMLRYVHGISVEQIAAIKRATAGSVKGHLRRGQAILKKQCEDLAAIAA